jgi:hypothetical protein
MRSRSIPAPRSSTCCASISTCIVGVPAAIANAVTHATGKRIRDLPITLDKLLV